MSQGSSINPVSADVREMCRATYSRFLRDEPILFCFRWTLLVTETMSLAWYAMVVP